MFTKQDILDVADSFIALTGARESGVSWQAFGESRKLSLLRGSADLTLARFNAAMRWFAANWPEGSERPAVLATFIADLPPAPAEDAA